MTNDALKEFLNKKSAEMSLLVRDFVSTAVGVYEGEQDRYNDSQCRSGYEEALGVVRKWLETVLLVELIETGKRNAGVVLHLPDQELSVSVGSEYYHDSICKDGFCDCEDDIFSSKDEDTISTPIGEMDYYTYKTIIDIKDNPVSVLYKNLSLFVHSIHIILGMPIQGKVYDVLGKELLTIHNIRDVLGVYKMDTLLYNIDAFFDGNLG